ncbi:hypothetical protein LXL04_028723 [Taraxacum kok-saghyz]
MAPNTKMASKPRKSASPIASNNVQADFSPSNFNDDVRIMAAILHKSDLNVYFQCISTQTLIRYITHAYQSAQYYKETDTLSFNLVDGSSESLTRFRFVSILGGHEGILELPPVYEPLPSDDDLSSFLEEIGHEDTPPILGDLKKAKFPVPWHMAVHFVLRCLSMKTGGTNAIVKDLLLLLWGVYFNKNKDFGGILWNDFRQYVIAKKAEVPSARFWSVILNKLYANHPTIAPEDDDVMFKPQILSKLSTNPKCPPSIRRLPRHLLRLVGMKRKVVKEYLFTSANLLPVIADVGANPEEPVAEATEHASEEEEETVSQPLQRKPKSVKFKSHQKHYKHLVNMLILALFFHALFTKRTLAL